MTDFRKQYALWNEFLAKCESMIQCDKEWQTVKLQGHPTQEEHDALIKDLYIHSDLPLSSIVRRCLYT